MFLCTRLSLIVLLFPVVERLIPVPLNETVLEVTEFEPPPPKYIPAALLLAVFAVITLLLLVPSSEIPTFPFEDAVLSWIELLLEAPSK